MTSSSPAITAILAVFPHAKCVRCVRHPPAVAQLSDTISVEHSNSASIRNLREEEEEQLQEESDRSRLIIAAENANSNKLLQRLEGLPTHWKSKILKSTFKEATTIAARLALSTSEMPQLSTEGARWLHAENKALNSRIKKNGRVPDWVTSEASDPRLEAAFMADLDSRHEWQQAQKSRDEAVTISKRLVKLEPIPVAALSMVAADEERIQELADIMAQQPRRLQGSISLANKEIHPREFEPATHRRRLHKEMGRTAIWAAGNLGLIGGTPDEHLPAYCDDFSAARHREKNIRIAKWADAHEIIDENGMTIPLSTVIENSKSARTAQWYAIVLGMEQKAKQLGFLPVFITATLPGIYHPNPKNGGKGHDPTISPTDSGKELNRRWRRACALLFKHKIYFFGVRTVEPHGDGCPHYHFCLWLSPDNFAEMERILRLHFGEGPEPLTFEKWDPTKGATAASYVMHYVLKSIANAKPKGDRDNKGKGEGEGEGEEEEEEEEGDDCERVRVWASLAGLRRIALVGLQPGTISRWKAAFRFLKSETKVEDRKVALAVRALKRRRWRTALSLLGAFPGENTYARVPGERKDRWGDTVIETIGWRHASSIQLVLKAKLKTWTIQQAPECDTNPDRVSVRASCPRRQDAAERNLWPVAEFVVKTHSTNSNDNYEPGWLVLHDATNFRFPADWG